MGASAIIALALKYGIPAGIQGYKFLREMLDAGEAGMTQAEFEAKWETTRARYKAAGDAWDEAGESPEAKA